MEIETVELTPDFRVLHSHYGDLTEEVATILLEEQRTENIVDAAVAEERQRHIVRACGQEATHLECGHVVAQIDESVFSYWEAREGPQFWNHELDRFLKRNPECAVHSRAANPTVRVDGFRSSNPKPSRSRRGGRWAL